MWLEMSKITTFRCSPFCSTNSVLTGEKDWPDPLVQHGGTAEGKMKNREGTVVDADDLKFEEMVSAPVRPHQELGKLDGVSDGEDCNIAQMDSQLGALNALF